MKKIAVVILNWNGEKLLKEFLPSVVEHSPEYLAEVIVADNGSTDQSIDLLKREFPSVKTLTLGENYGFAEGYNRALAEINNELVVLLNSDVMVTKNWLQPIVEHFDNNPETAACQPKIRAYRNTEYFEHAGAAGGFIDYLGYPFCRGRLFHSIEKDNHQYEAPVSIFWATGAALFIRNDVYKEVGGLDATFFAHMEEIDLCWRLKSHGKQLMCIPASTVFHLGAATLTKENPHKTYLNFRNNLLMLYKNLPASKLISTLSIRLLLDLVAMGTMLLKGQVANAIAVLKALFYFYHHIGKYKAKRAENLRLAKQTIFPEMLKRSIVVEFYLKRKSRIDF